MRSYRARGTSMLPGLYPRDRLWVREAASHELTRGAIVVFPGRRAQVVCHRIVAMDQRSGGRWFAVRGDAQIHCEWVEEAAIGWLLVEVEGRLGRWRADGLRGRLLQRWALSDHDLPAMLRLAAARALTDFAGIRRSLRGSCARNA